LHPGKFDDKEPSAVKPQPKKEINHKGHKGQKKRDGYSRPFSGLCVLCVEIPFSLCAIAFSGQVSSWVAALLRARFARGRLNIEV
jgi:hypothetical protein